MFSNLFVKVELGFLLVGGMLKWKFADIAQPIRYELPFGIEKAFW